MSDYGRCRDCKHCDPSETYGYKYYCEEYKTYEDPDKYRECKYYEPE